MFITSIWVRTLYRLRVKGAKNIPTQGPCIIVANHPGKLWADLMIMPALWPKRRPISVAYADFKKSKNKKVPKLMSWGAKVFPTIVSGRRGKGTALKATREILRVLKNGEAVFMMLSGEVSWTGRINDHRPAVPWTALKSGVPVLPCAIIGTYDVWPRWREKPRLTGKVTIRFGEPFTLNRKNSKRIKDVMVDAAGDQIKSEISNLFALGHA
jgi:1-acyl-sn-glycerol-3-phosphate acyltransferase